MSRLRGSKADGGKWDEETLDKVFTKALFISGSGDDKIALDKCGARIRRGAHGDTEDKQGWEVDHIVPVADGGDDDLDNNLQPLHWKNNRAKGDKPNSPSYEWCVANPESNYRNQKF